MDNTTLPVDLGTSGVAVGSIVAVAVGVSLTRGPERLVPHNPGIHGCPLDGGGSVRQPLVAGAAGKKQRNPDFSVVVP